MRRNVAKAEPTTEPDDSQIIVTVVDVEVPRPQPGTTTLVASTPGAGSAPAGLWSVSKTIGEDLQVDSVVVVFHATDEDPEPSQGSAEPEETSDEETEPEGTGDSDSSARGADGVSGRTGAV
jgi:hypothetical protein